MYLLISGGNIGGQFLSTKMASPYKALLVIVNTTAAPALYIVSQ